MSSSDHATEKNKVQWSRVDLRVTSEISGEKMTTWQWEQQKQAPQECARRMLETANGPK